MLLSTVKVGPRQLASATRRFTCTLIKVSKWLARAKSCDKDIDDSDEEDDNDRGVIHHVRTPPITTVVDIKSTEDDEDDADDDLKKDGDDNQADGHLEVTVLTGVEENVWKSNKIKSSSKT